MQKLRLNPTLVCLGLACAMAHGQSSFQVSSNSITLQGQIGSGPVTQSVGVASVGGSTGFSMRVEYLSGVTGWLSAIGSSGATPATIEIKADPANLAAGSYLGRVILTASATLSAQVLVTFTVGGTASNTVFISNPSSLSFAMSSGSGSTSQNAVITASNSGNVGFGVFAATASGGNWLSVSVTQGVTPQTVTLFASANLLGTGVYSGSVTITPILGGTPLVIPVTLTVNAGGSGITVNPATLSFTANSGAGPLSSQPVAVNRLGGPNVVYSATASQTWIRLTSDIIGAPAQTVSGNSGNYLNVSADPSALPPGNYSGTVTVNSSGYGGAIIYVSLTVNGSGILNLAPNSLSFTYIPLSGLPPSQNVTVSTAGPAVTFTAAASSTGWLFVTPQNGSTAGSNTLTISVSPGSLPSGTYTGTVNLTATGANSSATIPVTLYVGPGGVSSGITLSPNQLQFQSQAGGTVQAKAVALNTYNGSYQSYSAVANSGSPQWLSVSPPYGTAPSTLTVSVNPASLTAAGTYTGTVVVTGLSDGISQSITVTLAIGGGTVRATPQTLSFTQAANGLPPAAQQIQILSDIGGVGFAANSNVQWLSVSPSSGTAPAGISASVNGAGLSAGTYQGAVLISGPFTTISVPVTLTVSPAAVLAAAPGSLTFSYQTGGGAGGAAAPPSQVVTVTSNGATLPLNISVSSVGGWLSAVSNSNVTPAQVTVSVRPAGLAPGSYTGSVAINGPLGSGQSLTLNVTLSVAVRTGPQLRSSVNAASLEAGGVAPGEILILRGASFGFSNPINGRLLPGGAFDTTLGETRVLFDGVPAPLFYGAGDQLTLAVPYAVTGRTSTKIQVEVAGVRSDPMDLTVVETSPAVFTADSSGRGQAAAINQDGSVNSAASPAAAGSIIAIFGTGEGMSVPAGQDGRVISTDLRRPVSPVSVRIGGVPAEVTYAGSAPGLVSGVLQVNARVPAGLGAGPVAVEVQAGSGRSQAGATVAVR